MEFILWNREEFDRVYNCTGINVDDIPIEQRRYPIAAIFCILLGCIYYPLYFPCIYSFWKNRAKNPCYILLIYLSILDICTLWGPTFAHGFFSLTGVVYCSSPKLTYFVGTAYLFLWAAECSADLILGINRCIEMAFPNISKKLFHNNRIYIWIVFCTLYGIYWLLFRHPYIFNGITFQVLFDPLIGYKPFRIEFFQEDLKEFTIHNTILAIGSPVFIQVFIVSMFNTSAGIVYAYNMNHANHGILPVMIAHFSWLHIHGM
uniref:Uncharacterized protein n=1 Tax=Meloidogyne enterolobii TaxID=390850 RepID=A0A6V7TVW8_MELEN|nr:unnamed protein product [Meloidogyne enterolobii]